MKFTQRGLSITYTVPTELPLSGSFLHLQLDFEECFREHKSTRTFFQLHTLLSLIYTHTKFVIYHIFVIGIGVWLMLLLAIINGVFAFFHVWIWGPLLKLLLMVLYTFIKPIYSALVKVILYPVVETAGLLCRCKDRKTSTQCISYT